MPISSGALDWPVSYYTKPTDVGVVSDGTTDLDLWSHEHAYKNWTWKTKRGKRKKKRDKDNPDERRRHRRRCCCCVVWWLTALMLILLALTLFMVFWIHDRAHDLPPADPNTLVQCKGTWRETVAVYEVNNTLDCCYDLTKTQIEKLSQKAKVWPGGYTVDDCPQGPGCPSTSPTCGAVQLKISVWILMILVFIGKLAFS